jgi:hypothetical protein
MHHTTIGAWNRLNKPNYWEGLIVLARGFCITVRYEKSFMRMMEVIAKVRYKRHQKA